MSVYSKFYTRTYKKQLLGTIKGVPEKLEYKLIFSLHILYIVIILGVMQVLYPTCLSPLSRYSQRRWLRLLSTSCAVPTFLTARSRVLSLDFVIAVMLGVVLLLTQRTLIPILLYREGLTVLLIYITKGVMFHIHSTLSIA